MTSLWSEAMLHGHWEKIGGDTAKQILQTRLAVETEQEVIVEVQDALLEIEQPSRRYKNNA